MITVPKKMSERVAQRLKALQQTVVSCRDRDINESDTTTLVMDILCDLLGYDKYADITKEHKIRATFCDLAIRQGQKIAFLIECKAIGISLREQHMQQALNYAGNQGCEWVWLTNGINWQIHRVVFGQPLGNEMVYSFDILALSPRNQCDLEMLYAISKEGLEKSALRDFCRDREAKDRYTVAGILQTEPVLKLLRKELKALAPGVNVDTQEILDVLTKEVIKRDLFEGDRAADVAKRLKKAAKKREAVKAATPAQETTNQADADEQPSPVPPPPTTAADED